MGENRRRKGEQSNVPTPECLIIDKIFLVAFLLLYFQTISTRHSNVWSHDYITYHFSFCIEASSNVNKWKRGKSSSAYCLQQLKTSLIVHPLKKTKGYNLIGFNIHAQAKEFPP